VKANKELRGLALVAQRLGLSYQTVMKLVIAGDLPARWERGRWYVRLTDVVAFQRERAAEREQRTGTTA